MTAWGAVAVGVGAALGAWLRWLLGLAFNAVLPSLPMGTLAANLSGGLLIGAAVEFFGQRTGLAPEWRLLVITGFLGGLTTFSTFSAESVGLIQRGEWGWVLGHAALHLTGSVLLTFAGIALARGLLSGQ
ncbi:MAG: fluoride efflux transporter CrcB [Betaproteobacteria bacterium]|jgi:CrcB protein|nr:fluoride efflux transporter CrcB [Rhodocyclaceae bacterium]MCA3135437.1 fluoride efflux transporter CrcB [Rhodocyclaceae bacterium]MCA3143708.1 fluoride efflux transporter CrcB [Rhodocyclaceae bacterium]MCA3144476.1 fluoride efflux transporter CrcB [Rhodocyclaceae bacterium]MCE2897561.1 fluoride efflux transporter CrcB [Betaproteobacteria bacterium]